MADMAEVYAGGKIQRVPEGTLAGDFIPDDTEEADLVVSNGTGLRFVDADHVLQAGEKLIVTPRGVAG